MQTVKTPEDPGRSSGFSGFRVVNRQCPSRPSCNFLTTCVCDYGPSSSTVLERVRTVYLKYKKRTTVEVYT